MEDNKVIQTEFKVSMSKEFIDRNPSAFPFKWEPFLMQNGKPWPNRVTTVFTDKKEATEFYSRMYSVRGARVSRNWID